MRCPPRGQAGLPLGPGRVGLLLQDAGGLGCPQASKASPRRSSREAGMGACAPMAPGAGKQSRCYGEQGRLQIQCRDAAMARSPGRNSAAEQRVRVERISRMHIPAQLKKNQDTASAYIVTARHKFQQRCSAAVTPAASLTSACRSRASTCARRLAMAILHAAMERFRSVACSSKLARRSKSTADSHARKQRA